MSPGQSILCPVDFSEQSRHALRWASAIARHRGVGLTVLYVVEPVLARAAALRLHLDLLQADATPALREFIAKTLHEGQDVAADVRTVVATGVPADVIVQVSRREAVGLVVMGTHGLGGLRKVVLGSTTERVLRRTECPVLAVPTGATRAPIVAPSVVRLNTLLIATDFGQSARAATQWAAHLASDIGASLVLAHVVEPVAVPPWWQPLVEDFESDRAASGRRMLEQLAAGLGATRVVCDVALGPAADRIASMTSDHGADLVVMGLTGGADWTLRRPGSIAYRVLRRARVAVVVVPGPMRSQREAISTMVALQGQ